MQQKFAKTHFAAEYLTLPVRDNPLADQFNLAVVSVFGSGLLDGHQNHAVSNRKPRKNGNVSLEHAGEHRLERDRPLAAVVVPQSNYELCFLQKCYDS